MSPGRPSRALNGTDAPSDAPPTPTSSSTRKPVQTPKGPNILDLGTGTGIWAIVMANFFWPVDIEGEWEGVEYNWDMIHARMLVGQIFNWDHLYEKTFAHLRPGTGYFEQVDFDLTILSADGSIVPGTVFHTWMTKYKEAMSKLGCSIDIDGNAVRHKLRCAGFVDIEQEVIDVPVNPWEPGKEDIGRYMNLAYTHSLQAMSLRPLTRVCGMTPAEVNCLVQELGVEMCRLKWKPYVKLYIWTARRPDMARAPVSPVK
ncbi:hypothetical protein TD95_004027 [Thielaviopsis punctulata]|uniref:Methyltransferase domain-containing protein n=1 Tax=Thielaviopsis punctulata TaxID=72032 RepID=A0A0F4ZH17_9PEZI|nr:hypothetical protein TD95_004027 [Thielaviopsis punctulata]